MATKSLDVLIIGAGAAGLMCAIEAGKRGRKVLVLDHANKPGKKILMSGGGRCNFTNYEIQSDRFQSHNPHFCKSALSRYTQWDFIELVKKHQIPFHEKTKGQLFCNNKASDIVNMLLKECEKAKAVISLKTSIKGIKKSEKGFQVKTDDHLYACESLVIATGGLSIPTMGASPFGYQVAQQFGLNVYPTRAGLVPLTLHVEDKERFESLSGVSFPSVVTSPQTAFDEDMLFTHRGVSGPAILQISSYWSPGETLTINTLPLENIATLLEEAQCEKQTMLVRNWLAKWLPKRMIAVLVDESLSERALHTLNSKECERLNETIHAWQLKPNGTEGYRTAEVTLGGVDCDVLSSKTMETKDVPGLYFIGEVVDVTGWLGGYNFQWAWSSAWAAGQVV